MEKVNGGISCGSMEDDLLGYAADVTPTNAPVCATCGNYVRPIRSHFVCVNTWCSEFGIPKTIEQVKFKSE